MFRVDRDSTGRATSVNSEGFKIVSPIESASLRVSADTQAGRRDAACAMSFGIVEKRRWTTCRRSPRCGRDARDLPTVSPPQRDAPIGEDYTGPVLFEGRGQRRMLVTQSLVPLLLAAARPTPTTRGLSARRPGHTVPDPHRPARHVRELLGQRYAVADPVRR